MSTFILRQGEESNPQIGDIAFDEALNDHVELIDRISMKSGDDSYWLAKDSNNKYVIVNEWLLTNIGYYGD